MRVLVTAVLAIAVSPAQALAAGAWNSYLRPYHYNDLLVEGDTVWCATGEAGLLYYERSAQRFGSIVHEPGALASNHLTALAFDRRGRLWVGTAGAGASAFAADRSSWKTVNGFDGLPSDAVNVLEADGDTVWIGTEAGLAFWDGEQIAGTLPDGTNPSPFPNNNITGIAVWNGRLWIGTRRGVFHSDLANNLRTWAADTLGLPFGAAVDAMAFDGSQLFALDSLRVHRFDPDLGRWRRLEGIGDVYRLNDDFGKVMAASDSGLYRLGGTAFVVLNRGLRAPALDGGELPRRGSLKFATTVGADGRYFAAHVDGLFQQPTVGTAWSLSRPVTPPGIVIQDLLIDGPRIYLATDIDGIGRFDGVGWKSWIPSGAIIESDSTFRYGAYSYGFLVDRSGKKWLGSWGGALERFDDLSTPPHFDHVRAPRFGSTDDTTSSHTFVWASALDSSGGIWFGMDSPIPEFLESIGIDRYDASGAFVRNYDPVNSGLRGGVVHALAVSRNGRIWIGYGGQGVDYIDGPPVGAAPLDLRHVPFTDNLFVHGLATHGDRLWVLTTNELRGYDLAGSQEDSRTVAAQPHAEARRPIDVSADGTVWVGTLNGLRHYRLDGTYQDFNTRNSPLAADDVRAVRVDRSNGVVWIGTAGGLNRYDPAYVAPEPPRLARLEVTVFPNPARQTGLGVRLRLKGNASSYRGAILDISGRVLHRFAAGANGVVVWDGRDTRGQLAKPGIYLARVEAGGRERLVRFALLR